MSCRLFLLVCLASFVIAVRPSFAQDLPAFPSGIDATAAGGFDFVPGASPAAAALDLASRREAVEAQRLANQERSLGNDRLATGNRWLKLELSSFKRLVQDHARDLKRLRDAKARFESQKRQLQSFLAGQATTSGRLGLMRSASGAAGSPEIAQLLQMPVPALAWSEFTPAGESLAGSLLGSDGTLVHVPFQLQGSSQSTPLGGAYASTKLAWDRMAQRLIAGSEVGGEQSRQFVFAVERWQAVADEGLANGPRLDRVQAVAYFQKLRGLADLARQPARLAQLQARLRQSGFPGGTVGELVAYLNANNLSPRFGGEAHALLQTAGTAWLQEIERQIDEQESTIRSLVAANPAHASALKQMLAQSGMVGAGFSPALGGPTPQIVPSR